MSKDYKIDIMVITFDPMSAFHDNRILLLREVSIEKRLELKRHKRMAHANGFWLYYNRDDK